MNDWSPTRAAGLERMQAFVPGMGRAYAAGRNTDPGPGGVHAVSRLSPWVRRRLVGEDELARAALEAHGPRAAEKFVQEVIWRTYWKGWLELRPQVWDRYLAARDQARAAADRDPALARDLAAAEAGTTGIDAFDAWARELAETGWLHNHARMWFASIWIFTLKLPWALGADLFLRRLMDGDPASNTLSWRWVGGLQTVGKTYLATADNIARYTDGRFRPQGLARSAEPLVEAEPVGPARPLPSAARETPAGPHLLLVTPEDLTPEHLIGPWEIAGVALVAGPDAATEGPARTFLDGAVADAAVRAAGRYGTTPVQLEALDGAALVAAARAVGAVAVVTPAAPVGPAATALAEARAGLAAEGLGLVEVRRDWDSSLWPLATKGFFPFKEKAPQVLAGLGLPV